MCSPEITGENPFDRIDSQSSVCPFVCFHVIGSALLWADTGKEVYIKQSMTLKYAKNFDTPFGRFEYTHISKAAFSVGLTSIKKDGYAFVMATPEKALCDLIANSSKVNLRYLKDAEFIWKRISGWNGRIYADGCPVV